MAKKKVADVIEGISSELASALADVDANVGGGGALPTEWISSGNIALNLLLSGHPDRAFPVGRITALAGESGTGKSLIAASACREAQKKGYFVVYFDSESAIDATYLSNLGVDPSKVAFIATDTVESFRIKIVELLNRIQDEKVLFVLDSMGNLATNKELNDALEGKSASDMGLKAKALRATFRIIANLIAEKNAALIVTNHTYTNASGYVPVQEMSAGKGLLYTASIVLMLSKRKLREGKVTKGITINVTTEKNRFVPPFRAIALDMDFTEGLHKYAGLLDTMIASGIVEQNGAWYSCDGSKFQRKYFADWADEHYDLVSNIDLPTKFAITDGKLDSETKVLEEDFDEN